MAAPALAELGRRLCPWLHEPLDRLEAARKGGRLGHAWLLKGPAGIGKLNLALVFAHRLLDDADPGPPPPLDYRAAVEAMRARHTAADHHPDLHWIFPDEDKRSISIEQIRDIAQSLALKAFRGGSKVVIVEPAEAMTTAAANALLKTLEEPAPQTYLLLISHQPNRLLPTIRSRCQSLVLAPPSEDVVMNWLGISAASRRDALQLLFGRMPLSETAMIAHAEVSNIENLESQLDLISRRRIDAKGVAEEWLRADVDVALTWLVRRLQQAIRDRALMASDSKAITPRRENSLHNALLVMSTDALFERLESAERLLDQRGSGINMELVLHALLLSFQTTDRGRT